MATNPMQRRSRNSFLLGMLVMLLIAGAIAGVTIYMLVNEMTKLKNDKKSEVEAYVLTTSVKSGGIISEAMFAKTKVSSDAVPTNCFNGSLSEFGLVEKKTGNSLQSCKVKIKDTTMIDVSDDKDFKLDETHRVIMFFKENNNLVLVERNSENGIYYRLKANGFDIFLGTETYKDEDGKYREAYYMYVLDSQGSQRKLTKNDEEFFYENSKVALSMEALEFINNPMIAKVNLEPNTVLTYDMFTKLDEASTDDMRIQEFNMFSLPVKLNVDDYIDIRLTLPNGLDYIVVSKKRVVDVSENTIWLKVSEEEILSLSNAIVESYIMDGSKLTATLFVEPGLQAAATPTYAVSAEVYRLIQSDPNIVQRAKDNLKYRFSSSGDNLEEQRVRDINGQLSKYAEEAQENVNQKVQDEIDARREMRQKYIQQLQDASTIVEE